LQELLSKLSQFQQQQLQLQLQQQQLQQQQLLQQQQQRRLGPRIPLTDSLLLQQQQQQQHQQQRPEEHAPHDSAAAAAAAACSSATSGLHNRRYSAGAHAGQSLYSQQQHALQQQQQQQQMSLLPAYSDASSMGLDSSTASSTSCHPLQQQLQSQQQQQQQLQEHSEAALYGRDSSVAQLGVSLTPSMVPSVQFSQVRHTCAHYLYEMCAFLHCNCTVAVAVVLCAYEGHISASSTQCLRALSFSTAARSRWQCISAMLRAALMRSLAY
jgi:hypothetical protein